GWGRRAPARMLRAGNSRGGGHELPGRPRGKTAAYLQRSRRGIVGLLLRRANHCEHGNCSGPCPLRPPPAGVVGLGAPTTDRSGTGRSRRSTPSRGKPAHMGKGGSGFREGKETAMPKDASPNGDAPESWPGGSWTRVSEMQAKLHRWAVADPGRRFDDLFNFVYDPATLLMAFDRVATNRGANTPGVDGLTIVGVEERIGVPGFLDDLRASLKDGSFRPLPVRERKIPKPGGSGKVRKLGIPGIADRVVQAALKLVLEPIFEADFEPVSYGFRPKRRAHDAIAEIHHFGTRGYRWVLDATSRRPSTTSHTPSLWSGCGRSSRTSGCWRWSRRSSSPGCSPSSVSTANPHRHATGRHLVPVDLQHRPVSAR